MLVDTSIWVEHLRHRLMGRGVGWVDVHLLASAALESVLLWSADRRLAAIARSLGVYGEP